VNAHNLYFYLFQASKMWIQNKVDESKHDIHSQVDAIAAGTASVVNLTAGKTLAVLKLIKLLRYFTTLTCCEQVLLLYILNVHQQLPIHFPGDPTDTDYTAVGCAITTISSNLTEMSKGVKLLAALMEDEVGSGHDLMRAARTLTGAVSDLLKAVEPASGEVRAKDVLQIIISVTLMDCAFLFFQTYADVCHFCMVSS